MEKFNWNFLKCICIKGELNLETIQNLIFANYYCGKLKIL